MGKTGQGFQNPLAGFSLLGSSLCHFRWAVASSIFGLTSVPIEQGTRIRKPALNELLIGSLGVLGSTKEAVPREDHRYLFCLSCMRKATPVTAKRMPNTKARMSPRGKEGLPQKVGFPPSWLPILLTLCPSECSGSPQGFSLQSRPAGGWRWIPRRVRKAQVSLQQLGERGVGGGKGIAEEFWDLVLIN